jgi:hypothetical protein
MRAADAALGWPGAELSEFPEDDPCAFLDCTQLEEACGFGSCCQTFHASCELGMEPPLSPGSREQIFLRGLGAFLTPSERGFRGLEFQARLVWEQRYGACAPPAGTGADFVADLVARAEATGAPIREVVAALKDRLAHTPAVEDNEEGPALEALLGTSLDEPASAALEPALRRLCGVLVASPQFVLGGIAAVPAEIPTLTPEETGYDAVCAGLAGRDVPGVTVSCGEGALSVAGR